MIYIILHLQISTVSTLDIFPWRDLPSTSLAFSGSRWLRRKLHRALSQLHDLTTLTTVFVVRFLPLIVLESPGSMDIYGLWISIDIYRYPGYLWSDYHLQSLDLTEMNIFIICFKNFMAVSHQNWWPLAADPLPLGLLEFQRKIRELIPVPHRFLGGHEMSLDLGIP